MKDRPSQAWRVEEAGAEMEEIIMKLNEIEKLENYENAIWACNCPEDEDHFLPEFPEYAKLCIFPGGEIVELDD